MDSIPFQNCLALIDNSSYAESPPKSQPSLPLTRWLSCDVHESSYDSLASVEEPQSSMFQSAALRYCDSAATEEEQGEEQEEGVEDDDMYLLTEPPPERPILQTNHPFAQVKDELVYFTLQELFHAVTQSQLHRGKRIRHERSPPRRKRFRLIPDAHVDLNKHRDSEDDATMHIEHHRLLTSPAFACPYYARNPQAHRNCLQHADLRSIKQVKQHIWTMHRLPPFCPICLRIFDSATSCDQHVTERSCTLQTSPGIEGITQVQMQQLARRPSPALSEEEQWFAVWDILFPTEPRPARAVLQGDVEMAVCVLRDFWTRKGTHIMATFMEMKELREYDKVQDEERGLAALYAVVLEQLVEKVIAIFGRTDVNLTRQANNSVEGALAILGGLCCTSYNWQLDACS